MIIKTEELKDVCSKIYTALDPQAISVLTESVELKTEDTYLYLSVTNREYYVRVKINIGEKVDFHATVNANLFLKLIPQFTTDTIELTVLDNYLKVEGNGKYKLPLIFDDNQKLLELPQIEIDNVTNDFYVNSTVLLSILKYNSEELNKGVISKPAQKLYFVDDSGALTYTSGACVNSFSLAEPIKVLLNARLVRLFKLFKDGDIHFTLGNDKISDEISQTKVKFETNDVLLSAALSCSTDALIKSVPVDKIRQRATKDYDNVVYLNKEELESALARLFLFSTQKKPYGIFEFDSDHVTIYNVNKENKETLYYSKTSTVTEPYTMNLNISDLRITIKSAESDVQFNFGDGQAVVMVAGQVRNVIPEIKFSNT